MSNGNVTNPYALALALMGKYGFPTVAVVVLAGVVWQCTLKPMMAERVVLMDMLTQSVSQNADATQAQQKSLAAIAAATNAMAANTAELRLTINKFDVDMAEFRQNVTDEHQHSHDAIEAIQEDTTQIRETTQKLRDGS